MLNDNNILDIQLRNKNNPDVEALIEEVRVYANAIAEIRNVVNTSGDDVEALGLIAQTLALV